MLFIFSLKVRVAMWFNSKTRRCLKCKASPWLTWMGGRTNVYRRFCQSSGPWFRKCIDNQIFTSIVLRWTLCSYWLCERARWASLANFTRLGFLALIPLEKLSLGHTINLYASVNSGCVLNPLTKKHSCTWTWHVSLPFAVFFRRPMKERWKWLVAKHSH